MTRTPQSRSAARLRRNAGWRASGALGHGTAAIGRSRPSASQSRPRASVSLIPSAHLFTVLKLAGATTNASAGGSTSGSSAPLYWLRTGWPVSSVSREVSRNFMPSGVAITHTSQPCSWAEPANSGSCRAGGPPQATTYRTGAGWAAGTGAPLGTTSWVVACLQPGADALRGGPDYCQGMAARDDATTAPAGAPRPPLAYRLTARQWLGIDVAVAVIATGIALFNIGLVHHGFRYHLPTAVAATAVAGIAPVAARRIWPLPVLAIVTAACCVLTAYGHMRNLVYVALGMAIYTAATHCRRPVAVAAAVIVEVALGAAVLAAFAMGHHTQLDPARGPLVAGALWFIGDSVRERRRYQAGLAEQETQRRRAEAERGRQAVREERVRIARELHDVVAHSLSVVTVQA